MGNEAGAPRLRRTLGLVGATAIGLGAVIGAGVFVAIGPAVDVAGSAALLSLVIAGVIALFSSLSSAQLAAAYPFSGGTYVYSRSLINNLTGFLAGWIFIVATTAADSAVVLTFAAYLDFLFPAFPARWIAAVIALMVTALNYIGIRYSADVTIVLVVLKVLALLFFIGLGAFFFSGARLALSPDIGMANVLRAAAILFFAYTGFARIATLGEEVKDPQKTIPQAILAALGGSGALYLGTLLVALGLMGARGLAASNAPLSTAMETTGISAAVLIISLGALVATFSVFLTDLLGISRMVFAMARNCDLPCRLSAVHPRYGTPHLAILATGAVVILLTIFLPLKNLVEAGSFGLLVYYGITNLAAFLLPHEKRRYPRIWSAAGFLSCVGLAFFLPWRTIGIEMLVIAAGVAYFLIAQAFRGRRTSGSPD